MKKWLTLLFLLGGTSLSFAQYGSSSSGQNNNPYQSSRYEQQQGQQQQSQQQSQSPCDNLRASDPEAYAFSQQLSPIHQNVFCQQFTPAQRKQAMALAGSPTQDMQGKSGSITPDMAVEVVIQTARYKQEQQQQGQQQSYSNQQSQQQSYSYPNQSQNNNSSGGGRYSNY